MFALCIVDSFANRCAAVAAFLGEAESTAAGSSDACGELGPLLITFCRQGVTTTYKPLCTDYRCFRKTDFGNTHCRLVHRRLNPSALRLPEHEYCLSPGFGKHGGRLGCIRQG